MATSEVSGHSDVSLLMVDLLAAVYWFDDALQSGLKAKGWLEVSRPHSLVLTNMTSGVRRPSQLAKNLGVSHQAMSQTLAEMKARRLITIEEDPNDRRAKIVRFSPESRSLRRDAIAILKSLEEILASRIGIERLHALREAASTDWGPSPDKAMRSSRVCNADASKPRARPRKSQ